MSVVRCSGTSSGFPIGSSSSSASTSRSAAPTTASALTGTGIGRKMPCVCAFCVISIA